MLDWQPHARTGHSPEKGDDLPGYDFRPVPAATFSTALRQHRHPQAAYCRSLDRLHLAAMEELNISRLMTLDQTQGRAARALGYKVTYPGVAL